MSVFQESRSKVTMKLIMGEFFLLQKKKKRLKRFMAITSKKGVSITHHPNCEPALTTDLCTFWCYLKELEIGKNSNPSARP